MGVAVDSGADGGSGCCGCGDGWEVGGLMGFMVNGLWWLVLFIYYYYYYFFFSFGGGGYGFAKLRRKMCEFVGCSCFGEERERDIEEE